MGVGADLESQNTGTGNGKKSPIRREKKDLEELVEE